MKIKNQYVYIGILLLFSAFSFITSSQIASHAATSVISEGYSADKSVKWTVTDDGTMTIVPTNGKEGTLNTPSDVSFTYNSNWPFNDSHQFIDPNFIGNRIKQIIANTGIIHVGYATGLFSTFSTADSYTNNAPTSLSYIDISSFDTNNCVSFNGMFACQYKLKTIKTGKNFKGTKALNCSRMFDGCKNIEHIDLSTFNTPVCTNFESMFTLMPKLKDIDFSLFDTAAAINKTLSGNGSNNLYDNMNDFTKTYSVVLDNGTYDNGENRLWYNLKKITFGEKCIGKYQATYSYKNGTTTQNLGFPFVMHQAMDSRAYDTTKPNGLGYIHSTWTKTDGTYKNLTIQEIENKYSNDPSFKLAGTWIRDDALTQYNVTFKDGYMKNTISTKSISEGSNIAKSDFPSVKSYASDGIKFEGWFDESNKECTGGYTNVTKNMTLTARYRPYRITAKFICDDGSEAHIDMNTAYRTKITMPKYTGKVPAGKIFAMWSIKQLDGNTKLLHEDETIDVPVVAKCPTDDNGTITFKAVFTAVKNPDTNKNANQADVPAPTPDTNENVPIAPSPEPKNEPTPAPVTDPQPAAQPVADLVQTGVEILPAALAASAASIAAILIRRRTK